MEGLWLLEGESWDAVTWGGRRAGGVNGVFGMERHAECQRRLTLNIQGMSLRLAWMTSEARTELTENSSSLKEE